MSKSERNGDRLKNSKRIHENRSKRHEIKQIIRDGRFDELDSEEEIEVYKEPDFKLSKDR